MAVFSFVYAVLCGSYHNHLIIFRIAGAIGFCLKMPGNSVDDSLLNKRTHARKEVSLKSDISSKSAK